MLSYRETLLILILTLVVIYGCTMCYLQAGSNRELEEKITTSDKELSEKIREYEKEIKRGKEPTKSCERDLQTRKENVEECMKLLETRKSLIGRIEKGQKDRDTCTLKRRRLQTEYEDCNSDDTDVFKSGNEANKIKYFVLFIGYPRSGHSIVAALLDAHPHVVISHELNVVMTWRKHRIEKEKYSKYDMFKKILKNTGSTAKGGGFRSANRTNKYYTLDVPGLYQGQYEDYIEVIGDKKGGSVISMEKMKIEDIFVELENFQKFEGYPLKFFHVVRNPYDNIATEFLYGKSTEIRKETFSNNKVWDDVEKLGTYVRKQTWRFGRIQEFIGYFGDRVLTLHHEDLISDPESFLNKMCGFLEIECNSFYIETAANSVFTNTTMSRRNVVWDEGLRLQVDSVIQEYSFLNRYSFEE